MEKEFSCDIKLLCDALNQIIYPPYKIRKAWFKETLDRIDQKTRITDFKWNFWEYFVTHSKKIETKNGQLCNELNLTLIL